MKLQALALLLCAASTLAPCLAARLSDEDRQKLLLEKIDTSHGRAHFCASAFKGLTCDNLKYVADLHDWLEDIRERIKSQPKFQRFEKHTLQYLAPDSTLRLNCYLTPDGQAVEGRGRMYNYPKESRSTAAVKQSARQIITAAGPFLNPPNVMPTQGGLMFEFYATEDKKLDVAVIPMLKGGMFPLRPEADQAK